MHARVDRAGRQPARSTRPAFSPARHPVAPVSNDAVVHLQRTVGNRAVARLLSSSLKVTPADHGFEQEATRAERSSVQPGRPILSPALGSGSGVRSPLASDAGRPLDDGVLPGRRAGQGPLDGVRVHTGDDADALTASLGAEALTHGSDIFVSREHYQPGTEKGARLLAHEAAHATGAAAASGFVHLKRSKKHLDFLRIKKKDTHIAREVAYKMLSGVGATKQAEKVITDKQGEEYDTYGHWWIEAGSLTDPTNLGSWKPLESYGWWPSKGVSGLKELFKIKTLPGVLNRGEPTDPHHGEAADTEYHPVLEVDDKADYKAVRDQVIGDVRTFAKGFSGSWNWRLAWGKNCHTFVDRLKKRIGLHHQAGAGWLIGEGVQPQLMPFDEIRTKWSDILHGNGFNMLDTMVGLLRNKFQLGDLAALSDDQKTELLSILNDGVADDFNIVRPNDINAALASTFGTKGADIFSERHAGAHKGGSGPQPKIDVEGFLNGLQIKSVHTLAADLQLGATTAKAGSKVMVIEIDDDRVRIELPMTEGRGGGRMWVDAAKLAVAFGAA